MIKPELDGVPETLLWTLYHRALEARRPDALLSDPRAIELVDTLDYPFETGLGDGGWGVAQWQALRTLSFDAVVRDFLAEHPSASVVALGAGLETQSFRIDNGRARWLSVDLPQVARLRRSLLPDTERMRSLGASALDASWMEHVDDSEPVLITAQGLLMYLDPDDVHGLLARSAQRFRRGAVLFDAIPSWYRMLTMRGWLVISKGYLAPVMPWALTAAERTRLGELDPNITAVRELPFPRGRGVFFKHLLPMFDRAPWFKYHAPMRTVLMTLGS